MNIKENQGFTLIELMVVIAIIGILSALVLASLGTSRNRGNDGAIKSDLHTVGSQAEVFSASNNFTYAGGTGVVSPSTACPALQATNAGANYGLMGDSQFFKAVSAANGANGSGYCAYINTANSWAVAVQLNDDPKTAWCIDLSGTGKQISDVASYTQATLNADISTGVCGS